MKDGGEREHREDGEKQGGSGCRRARDLRESERVKIWRRWGGREGRGEERPREGDQDASNSRDVRFLDVSRIEPAFGGQD